MWCWVFTLPSAAFLAMVGYISSATHLHLAFLWPAVTRSGNDELMNKLVNDGFIRSPEVHDVMRRVDRANYVSNPQESPYLDAAQPIEKKANISAPHTHAYALERLHMRLQTMEHSGGVRKALDVGSGSGYLTAALALLLGPEGRCFGVERSVRLVAVSKANVDRDQGASFRAPPASRVIFYNEDGWNGLDRCAPFDVIHVGAAAATMPEHLVEQLAPGGRMIVPVGTSRQRLMEVDKAPDGTVTQRALKDVRYEPLVRSSLFDDLTETKVFPPGGAR